MTPNMARKVDEVLRDLVPKVNSDVVSLMFRKAHGVSLKSDQVAQKKEAEYRDPFEDTDTHSRPGRGRGRF